MVQRLRLLALGLVLHACGSDGLEITTTSVPNGVRGESYAAPIGAEGGTEGGSGPAYVWSIASGALPAGLALAEGTGNATVIAGTPTEVGRFEFTVAVKDSAGSEASHDYVLVVSEPSTPLEITTEALADAAVGEGYAAEVLAQGGAGAGYAWSIASGSLPGGLALSAEGTPAATISGQATEAGNFTFTVEVTDGEETSRAALSIVVVASPPALSIETVTLPDGSVDAPYDAQLVASGGSGAGYQWRIEAGAVPGLTLEAAGTPTTHFAGAPLASGNFELTIVVEDEAGDTASQPLSVRIFDALSIPEVVLPRGRQGVAYTATITAVAGAGAGYQWRFVDGHGIVGLVLSDLDQATMSISGSPAEFGNFTFTMEVTDAHGGLATRTFDFLVDPVAVRIDTATVAFAQVGAPFSATIGTVNGSGAGYTWTATGLPPGLSIDATGAPSTTITGLPTAFGAFTATVTVADVNGDQDAAQLSFEVAPPAVYVTTTALPGAVLGQPYAAPIVGAQGSGTGYRWWISQGTLPYGLTLDPAGTPSTTLSGFPREAGTFAFTISLVDANGQTDSASLSLEVTRDLAIQTRALPRASVGEAYALPLEAAGGTPPYIWTIHAGSLPSGLGLVPATSTVASISGVPTLVAPARFTVQVEDAVGATDARDYMLAPRSAQQWAGTVGDTVVDNDGLVVLVDVSGLPSNYLTVSPPAPGTGDASTDDDDAVFAPNNNMLAYIGDFLQDGVYELFVVYMATGAPANPTRVSAPLVTGGDVNDFKWSPDGQRLLYTADQNTDGQYELFEVEVGGLVPGTPRQVSAPLVTGGDIAPQDFWWSPDGRWAIYLADASVDTDYELWATDILAPGPARPVRLHDALPAGADVDDGVVFVPDGSGLVFLADLAVANDHNLYFVDLSGPSPGAPTQLNASLPASGDVNFDRYAFSPDGRRLLYVADQNTNDVGELFVVDTHFPTPAPSLRVSPALGDPGMDVFGAVWSPDSRKIAFSSDAETEGVTELFMVDVSRPAPRGWRKVNASLPSTGDIVSTPVSGFGWSSDGGWIAYRADTEVDGANDLMLARMDGPTTTATVVRVNPTLVSGADVDLFRFAPDGQRVVFVGDVNVQGQAELFVVDLSGPLPGSFQQVNRPMVSGGDVSTVSSQLRWSRDSTRIYYRADEIADNDFTARMVDVTVTPLPASLEINPSLPTNGDVSFFFLQE